jgi:hypothetical protein
LVYDQKVSTRTSPIKNDFVYQASS